MVHFASQGRPWWTWGKPVDSQDGQRRGEWRPRRPQTAKNKTRGSRRGKEGATGESQRHYTDWPWPSLGRKCECSDCKTNVFACPPLAVEGAPGGSWGGLWGGKGSPKSSWGIPWGALGRPLGSLGGLRAALGDPGAPSETTFGKQAALQNHSFSASNCAFGAPEGRL